MKLHHQKQFWLFAFLLRIHSRFMKCLYLMRNSLHTDIFYFLCCPRAIKAIKETSVCRLYKHCNIISLNTEVDTNLLCVHTCITQLFLWVTRGAHNPNLKVVNTHASHVCSQHSFGLPLRMNRKHVTQFNHAHLDLLSLAFWSCMFWPTICHVKLMQSTALEQKRFDLRSLLPTLCNLWLPLYIIIL